MNTWTQALVPWILQVRGLPPSPLHVSTPWYDIFVVFLVLLSSVFLSCVFLSFSLFVLRLLCTCPHPNMRFFCNFCYILWIWCWSMSCFGRLVEGKMSQTRLFDVLCQLSSIYLRQHFSMTNSYLTHLDASSTDEGFVKLKESPKTGFPQFVLFIFGSVQYHAMEMSDLKWV